ncbi:MAG TPA: lipopolysaccharide heptosyltransferase II [Lentisphaeria bacterium]|nr:MAG: lipopolysaccharide heptosyltransferase II [Lentisphaerae bacterium GWF2_50_93]HCE44162.1 lipopolysaccharide heptosyltransferase II [Lentisphaeria bacterium]
MNELQSILGKAPVFPKIELKPSYWKKGLIVRTPNWLGDAVMGIPALFQLKKAMPAKSSLAVVTPKGISDIFKSLPFIDEVIETDNKSFLKSKKDVSSMRSKHAGVGILFNNSFKNALLMRLAGIPKIYGASARGRKILLSKAFNFPRIRKSEFNDFHQTGLYLSMVYSLGAEEWKGDFPEFRVAKKPEQMKKELSALAAKTNILVLAPGAAYGEAKRWPSENYREVCAYWVDKGGHVVIAGAGKEADIAQIVAKGFPEDKVFNLAGKTDISELIFLLQKAEFCVANDSGIMHLAAAVGTEGVAIFGSTDPFLTGPLSKKWKVFQEKQSCAPCFKRECATGQYKCLRAIRPEDVIDYIKSIK